MPKTELQVQGAELGRAIRRVASIIPNRPTTKPLLRKILLAWHPDRPDHLALIATDLESWVSVGCKVFLPSGPAMRALAEPAKLLAIAEGGGDILLARDGTGPLEVITRRLTIKLEQAENADDFPNPRRSEQENQSQRWANFHIPAESLVSTLEAIVHFPGEDRIFSGLQGVVLRTRSYGPETHLEAIASDGSVMGRARTRLPIRLDPADGLFPRMILPQRAITPLVRGGKAVLAKAVDAASNGDEPAPESVARNPMGRPREDEVDAAIADAEAVLTPIGGSSQSGPDLLRIEAGPMVVYCRLLGGRLPDFDQYWPAESVQPIALFHELRSLEKGVNMMKVVHGGRKGLRPVRITLGPGRVLWETQWPEIGQGRFEHEIGESYLEQDQRFLFHLPGLEKALDIFGSRASEKAFCVPILVKVKEANGQPIALELSSSDQTRSTLVKLMDELELAGAATLKKLKPLEVG